MKLNFLAFIILCFCIIITACNEEITVGADLLEDQPITIEYTDQIPIVATTVISDSLLMYVNSSTFDLRTNLIGELDDPIFGKSNATLFITPRVSRALPELKDANIDSIILVLPLDSLGAYGTSLATHNVELSRLTEPVDLENTTELYSNDCIEFESTPIASLSIVANLRDSVSYYDPNDDTIALYVPQMRFPLDVDLWEDILIDSLVSGDTQELVDLVHGYAVKSTPSESSLIGINMLSTSSAEVQIFYTDTIAEKKLVAIDVNSMTSLNNQSCLKHNCFDHDYAGTAVELGLGSSNAEFNYLQGMQGLNVEYDLSGILNYTDVILNHAVLEVFVVEDSEYAPVNAITAEYRTNEGGFSQVEDQVITSFLFDGSIQDTTVNGVPIQKYEILLTSHLINIINGEIENTTLTLQATNKRSAANRSILYSPNHPDYPARLKLITTKP